MKVSKKKVAVVSLVVCLIAILSLGSLAWFSDTDEITNTLKFVDDFAMEVYETDEAGNILRDKTTGQTIGETFENLTPGQSIHKDPTVINKGSTASQYVRVSVTVSKAFEWVQAGVASGYDLTGIFKGFEDSLWTRYDEPVTDAAADTITYVFYLNDELLPGKTATLFTSVKIPESLTIEQAAKIGDFTITIKAEAIQTTDLGIEETAKDAAYQAFKVVEGEDK